MQAVITNTLIKNIKITGKRYDICDTKLKGFRLRVSQSGKLTYACIYSRGERITIGTPEFLTPTEARDKAKEILGKAMQGIPVKDKSSEPSQHNITLSDFVLNEYAPWREANRKSAKEELALLESSFYKDFGNTPLREFKSLAFEKWRSRRLKNGIKPATVNRDIARIKSLLTKAEEWGFIDSHPLAKFKLLKLDNSGIVRFLNTDEENRLIRHLKERDTTLIQDRESGNQWRAERGYSMYPTLKGNAFADHMTPMILISLNTGIRQGELFNLTWKDINFGQNILSVRADNAKSGKTRHVPLNSTVISVMRRWQSQTSNHSNLVFPNKDNKPFHTVKTAWHTILKHCKITEFRWHDMRHHFASKLVMAGVDINTVRELMGHAKIEMTLRYAHLAPEHKANAVAKLVMPGSIDTI